MLELKYLLYIIIIVKMLKTHDWINIKKLNWTGLSQNTNAIEMLLNNQDKLDWNALSENINAIELLKQNQENNNLKKNKLLKENKTKINWDYLSKNINAIELLKKIRIKLIGNIYLKI